MKRGTQEKTLRNDMIRAVPMGMLESVATTFGIMIAVRVFQSGLVSKSLIVAAFPIGLLVSLFIVQWVKRLGVTANYGIAALNFISAIGFGVIFVLPPSEYVYVFGILFGAIGVSGSLPLMSQLYRELYPDQHRGRLFAYAGLVRKVFTISAALIGGYILSRDLSAYRWIFLFFSAASVFAGILILRYESVSMSRAKTTKLFSAFRHVKHDREFRNLLIAWMFLGVGNLLCTALFVGYISDRTYGYDFNEFTIGMISAFVPEVAYMLVVTLWGRLFDQWNFYLLRATINLFFAAGLGFYFLGHGTWSLVLGIGLHGIAKAGGNVAWSLWVTKFAKPEHVVEYMSVHTFLTGCRGLVAPFLAFACVAASSPQFIAVLGISLILFATLLISPNIRFKSRRREGMTIVPDPRT